MAVFAAIAIPLSLMLLAYGMAPADALPDEAYYVIAAVIPVGFFALFTDPLLFFAHAAVLMAWFFGVNSLLRRTRLSQQGRMFLVILTWPFVTFGSNLLLYLVLSRILKL